MENMIDKKIDELIEKFKEANYESLVKTAKMSVVALQPYCKFLDAASGGLLFIAVILEHALMADGEISETEQKFLKDVFGDAKELVDKWMPIKPGFIDIMFELLNAFIRIDVKAKTHLTALVATLLVCDNRITVSEENYLKKLFSDLA